jgi:hypothetical protein
MKKYSALPFGLPALVVTGKGPIGEALKGLGLNPIGDKAGVYIGRPSVEQFAGIYNLVPEKDHYEPVPAGNANIKGYFAAIWLWRGVGAFFDLGGGGDKSQVLINAATCEEIAKKCLTKVQLDDGWKYGAKEDEKKKIKAHPSCYYMLSDAAVLSKSTRNHGEGKEYVYSDSKSAPVSGQGYVLPYFSGMLNGDPTYASETFINIFARSVSTSVDATIQILQNIRLGTRSLMTTENGKILQHIYQLIRLSARGGETGFLIANGGCYGGFFITGENSTLIARGKSDCMGSREECIELIKALNQHEEALIEIGSILTKIPVNGMAIDFDIERAKKSPRYVFGEIRRRGVESIEGDDAKVKKLLAKEIKRLRYEQEFWIINQENITRFITCIATNADLKDAPMLCEDSVLLNRSSIVEYLSVFGFNAPSIFNGDQAMKIPMPGTEDINLVEKDGKRRMPFIPYIIKGLNQASSDWGAVRSSGGFKYFAAKKGGAGKFDDVKKRSGVIDKKHLDEAYPLLKAWMHADMEQADIDKKRAAGDVNMEKSKKIKLDSSSLL